MQEYNDGTYGPILDAQEALARLASDEFELARTRHLHFGTERQLERLKAQKPAGGLKTQSRRVRRIRELERRIRKLEARLQEEPGRVKVYPAAALDTLEAGGARRL